MAHIPWQENKNPDKLVWGVVYKNVCVIQAAIETACYPRLRTPSKMMEHATVT